MILAADPGRARVVAVLTVDPDGLAIRVATWPIDVEDAAVGTSLRFGGGLVSVTWSAEVPEPGGESPSTSVSVSVLDDGETATYGELVARGFRLALARAEVAVIVEGQDWSERQVVVLGQIQHPEWGVRGEPVRFTVAARVWEDPSTVPPPTWLVDGTTWPAPETLLPEHLGKTYPIVFGRPGVVSDNVDSSGMVAATVPVWAEYDPTMHASSNRSGIKLVLCGGHTVSGAVGTAGSSEWGGRVYMRDANGLNVVRMRARNGFDQRGQPVTWMPWWSEYTSGPPPDDFEYDAGTNYTYGPTDDDGSVTYGTGENVLANTYWTEAQELPFVTWLDDIRTGGGLLWRGRLCRDAVDVLHWCLSQTGQNIDGAAFDALRGSLSAYKIDSVIASTADGERLSPWEWARQNVLPVLPVSVVMGPRGLRPVVWRWHARAADATVRLDLEADPSIGRDGPVTVDTSNVRNRFVARYALSARSGQYVGKMTMGPDAYDPDEPTRLESAACRVSASLHRHPNGSPYVAEETVDLPAVCDDLTVAAVLNDRAAQMALGVESAAFVVPMIPYGRSVAEGAVAIVNDPERGHVERVALVTGYDVDPVAETLTVRVRILADLSALWSAA